MRLLESRRVGIVRWGRARSMINQVRRCFLTLLTTSVQIKALITTKGAFVGRVVHNVMGVQVRP